MNVGLFGITGTANTFTGDININGGGTYSVGTPQNSGIISGAISLVKDGAATTLTLGGINTYTGTTTVSGGTLALGSTGSIVGLSEIIVEADGTFDVLALAGSFELASGQTLGGSGLILGDFDFNAASVFEINLGSPISVSVGDVTFGVGFGIANLTGINWDRVALDTPFTLISTDQTFGPGDIRNFGLANAAAVGSGRFAYFQDGSLSMVVVPEPSTYARLG
ncbi:MAG: autotransporter-associated beta strand repeat-containing protein [Planctomycetota bacterium]